MKKPNTFHMVKEPAKAEPAKPEVKRDAVDHLAAIRELAMDLNASSPSGVETIAAKIMAHLDAHKR